MQEYTIGTKVVLTFGDRGKARILRDGTCRLLSKESELSTM